MIRGTHVLIMGDGDNIRDRCDRLLLAERLEDLAEFSDSVSEAISELATSAGTKFQASIIVAGGDDIIFIVKESIYNPRKITTLIGEFKRITGNSISFGVGGDVSEAYINLRKAKCMGGGRLVDLTGVHE